MKKNPTVQVGVIWKESKKRYYLKWKDPFRPRYVTRQTDVVSRSQKGERAAAKIAVALERELNESLRKPDSGMSWEQFRTMYETDRLTLRSKDNRTKWRCVANVFEEVWPDHVHGVLMLDEITPKLLIAVETRLRQKLAEASVASYSATLRAGFSYAAKIGLMPQLPGRPPTLIEQNLPAMRLSPISLESLERMELAAEKVAGKQHAQGIADYMRCLWLCGGRLIDPLWMHAYRVDCHHPIVLEGSRPMFGWVSRQKNKRDQIARVSLDFANWIRNRVEGSAFLFNPTCEHGRIESKHQLSSLIADIGAKANVIAEPSLGKTATAKHFRSSFVTRWSRRGMPIEQISAMVRHGNIETTKKYYLAPSDPALLRDFQEQDWIGDQIGDHSDAQKSISP